MKIDIKRLNDGFHLEASNDMGNTIQFDASPDVGGTNKGMRPMQVLLSSLGACSAVDVISILKKQRQPVEDIKITVTGEREKNVTPAAFRAAHVHFRIIGQVDEEKVSKAVTMSVEKYCSVAKSLEALTKITHSFEIVRK